MANAVALISVPLVGSRADFSVVRIGRGSSRLQHRPVQSLLVPGSTEVEARVMVRLEIPPGLQLQIDSSER